MTERFFLNGDTLPTVPTPHDCVMKHIRYDNEYLTFEFQDDICEYDSVKAIHPSAKSLIMRIHLSDPVFYVYKFRYSRLKRKGIYCETDVKKFTSLSDKTLEYLSHTVGFTSFVIKLFQDVEYVLDICADFVEFEWIEK